jgi:hypothetical protein
MLPVGDIDGTRLRRFRPTAAAIALVGVIAMAAPDPAHASMASGIWISPGQVDALPESGAAWRALEKIANGGLGKANIRDQNNEHDTKTLATALVYARTRQARYRAKAAAAIMAAIGTEKGGRTLALARSLIAYVIAADLIGLGGYDPVEDQRFRRWLRMVQKEPLHGLTLRSTHERRANNWGTLAGASREAADVYLGNTPDLARAAAVFKGWLGDRAAYHGFKFGADLSWQADPRRPVGVDPPGTIKKGLSLDGALPDDMRRGCPLRVPPCPTKYPWEAMQGAVAQAEILSRQGYDAFGWEDQALRRAAEFLYGLHRRFGAGQWFVPPSDAWIPWVLDARYGMRLPTRTPVPPGRGIGYTDWTAAAEQHCAGAGCAPPPAPAVRHRVRAHRRGRAGNAGPPIAVIVATIALLMLMALVARRVVRVRG